MKKNRNQMTLVAYYLKKTKPQVLNELIIDCQQRMRLCQELNFKNEYSLDQIHATIIGLEGKVIKKNKIVNKNFFQLRKKSVKMDIESYLRYLLTSNIFPIKIQIGGFVNKKYSFNSQGNRPYVESFSIKNNIAVLKGWPVELIENKKLKYTNILNEIRTHAQNYGILHAYHQTPLDIDNDFYFRLGIVNIQSQKEKENIENEIRYFLSNQEPLIINILPSAIFIVLYNEGNELLEPNSINNAVTIEKIYKNYSHYFSK